MSLHNERVRRRLVQERRSRKSNRTKTQQNRQKNKAHGLAQLLEKGIKQNCAFKVLVPYKSAYLNN
jgi:hypothetical protein